MTFTKLEEEEANDGGTRGNGGRMTYACITRQKENNKHRC
jgi:hypothetical protein